MNGENIAGRLDESPNSDTDLAFSLYNYFDLGTKIKV